MGPRAATVIGRLRAHDYAVFAFGAIVVAILLAGHSRLPNAGWLVVGHVVGLLAVFALTQFVPLDRPAGYAVRHLYVALVIPICFSAMGAYVHPIRLIDYDPLLAQIDRWLFGVHPTVWLAGLHHPALTEICQLCYSTFYFLPVVLAVVLMAQRRWPEFELLVFMVTFGFFLSYLGYIAVPAVGPRLALEHLHPFPLEGLWSFEPIRHTLDSLEQIKRDCFPSGHTMMTLATLVFAARMHRPTFWVLLPIGAILVFSTVYLRYHYVIDLLMGVAFLFLLLWTVRPLFDWLGAHGQRESFECSPDR
jgi:membrane-associated phospholipid phosphatase